MAKANPIAPFPPDIDRVAFGHWLSGFTDGEGTFNLYFHKDGSTGAQLPKSSFAIGLRADDRDTLCLIQSYFGVGFVSRPCPRPEGQSGRPFCQYSTKCAVDLAAAIAPHFEQFPLRAKKSRDFAIWKRGVALCALVATEPRRAVGYGKGHQPRWTPNRLALFAALRDEIAATRAYREPTIGLP